MRVWAGDVDLFAFGTDLVAAGHEPCAGVGHDWLRCHLVPQVHQLHSLAPVDGHVLDADSLVDVVDDHHFPDGDYRALVPAALRTRVLPPVHLAVTEAY